MRNTEEDITNKRKKKKIATTFYDNDEQDFDDTDSPRNSHQIVQTHTTKAVKVFAWPLNQIKSN